MAKEKEENKSNQVVLTDNNSLQNKEIQEYLDSLSEITIKTKLDEDTVYMLIDNYIDAMELDSVKNMISCEHYPYDIAKKEMQEGAKKKYEVTTINESFANQNKNDIDYDPNKPSPNFDEVHKNKYIFTLEELIVFSSSLIDVCEEIIYIKPLDL